MSTARDRQKSADQRTAVDVETRIMNSDHAAPSQRPENMTAESQSTQPNTLAGQSEIIGPKFGTTKQHPDPVLKKKMYNIAKPLGDLNANGKVKKNLAHEHGYAKVHQIKSGCSIWIHHTLDNWLVIDLLITPYAREQFSKKCSSAVDNFKEFFKHANVIRDWWAPKDKPEQWHDRYSIDIKLWDEKSIFATLDELKSDFEKMP